MNTCMASAFTLSTVLVGSFMTGLLGQGTVDPDCLYCMCVASSGCREVPCHKPGDGNYYCGPFQITFGYWNDSGRPVLPNDHNRAPQAYQRCAQDFECSSRVIINYMNKWVKDCDGDNSITCHDYARIHKAGPFGCSGQWAVNTQYWNAYSSCMNK